MNTYEYDYQLSTGTLITYAGFPVLLVLLPIIGYPMLGFGSARYAGPAAAATAAPLA